MAETLQITDTEIREYLHPPGDSTRVQPMLDTALQQALDVVVAEGIMQSVTIEVVPDPRRNR